MKLSKKTEGEMQMAKYDKMVEYIRTQSSEKETLAMNEMTKMFKADERISVAELVRRTQLSRGFFYNNEKVHSVLIDLMQQQNGRRLRNPKHEAIERAQKKLIEELQKQLKNTVPKSEYEKLKQQYKELETNAFTVAFDNL